MPWTIVKSHPSCPTAKPIAVVNKSTGRVAGCHSNMTKAQKHIAVLKRVAEALVQKIDTVIEAVNRKRRSRKVRDTNGLLRTMQTDLKVSWNELANDLKKEWDTPAIRRTFEARRPGPSPTQIDALYNRARTRAERRQAKAIDRDAKKAMVKGAASALKDLNGNEKEAKYPIKWDVKNKAAIKWLKGRGAERVKNISKTTRKKIKALVVKLASEGKNHKEIGREIDSLVKGWSKQGTALRIPSRGALIAITEVGEAYEQGRLQVRDMFTKAGLKVEKIWEMHGDELTCVICESGAGDGWISNDEIFSNGLEGPLAHPACRCDLSLQVV